MSLRDAASRGTVRHGFTRYSSDTSTLLQLLQKSLRSARRAHTHALKLCTCARSSTKFPRPNSAFRCNSSVCFSQMDPTRERTAPRPGLLPDRHPVFQRHRPVVPPLYRRRRDEIMPGSRWHVVARDGVWDLDHDGLQVALWNSGRRVGTQLVVHEPEAANGLGTRLTRFYLRCVKSLPAILKIVERCGELVVWPCSNGFELPTARRRKIGLVAADRPKVALQRWMHRGERRKLFGSRRDRELTTVIRRPDEAGAVKPASLVALKRLKKNTEAAARE